MKKLNRWNILLTLVMLLFSVSVHSVVAKAKLTMEQAKLIATKKVPGTIKSSEFEHEMGQDVYSFDIIGSDQSIHEILVSANTGKIISNKIESAAQEAKEATEEKK